MSNLVLPIGISGSGKSYIYNRDYKDYVGVKIMVAIIDYNAGNLKSVEKALLAIGQESVITRDFHTTQ